MNGKTHRFMTKIASAKCNFTTFKLKQDELELLLKYSVMPDEDEGDELYKYHFYNPATGLNYKGEKDSAVLRIRDHFEKALSYKTERNKTNYLQELGRSIHFLQDICTPVHTYYEDSFDAVVRVKQHMDFENYCDMLHNKIDPEQYYAEFVIKNPLSLKDLGKAYAIQSNYDFYKLDTTVQGSPEYITVAVNSIKRGIMAGLSLIERAERY